MSNLKVNKRGDHEPVFLLGPMGIIVSLIFFPIGIFVLLFSTIIYLADWMCYNFNWPRPLCWIFAFILGPFFLPLVLLSFLYEMLTGDDTYSTRRYSSKHESKEEKVLSSKKSSPKRSSKSSSPKLSKRLSRK